MVTILYTEDFEKTYEYLKENKCKWLFLSHENDPDVLKKYDIKAYPTYFFIDKEGKLALSPAQSPTQDIETQILRILKED